MRASPSKVTELSHVKGVDEIREKLIRESINAVTSRRNYPGFYGSASYLLLRELAQLPRDRQEILYIDVIEEFDRLDRSDLESDNDLIRHCFLEWVIYVSRRVLDDPDFIKKLDISAKDATPNRVASVSWMTKEVILRIHEVVFADVSWKGLDIPKSVYGSEPDQLRRMYLLDNKFTWTRSMLSILALEFALFALIDNINPKRNSLDVEVIREAITEAISSFNDEK